MTDLHWIVARTKPKQEAWAKTNIERQGFTVFIPMYRNEQKAIVPLFPSFAFVLSDGSFWFLKNTFGVLYPMMVGELPATVPDRHMDTLFKARDRQGLVRLEHKTFKQGQQLRVKAGLFVGQHVIYQSTESQDRIKVLLSILGRRTVTTIRTSYVEAVA